MIREEMENEIQIIDVIPELWEVYKEIRLKALQEDPQAFGRSYEEELAFPEEKWRERSANTYNTIAMENENPIGTMGAFVLEENGKQVANIVGVFVASEARGNGVGSMLMERVLEKIKNQPSIKAIRLTVNKDQLAAVKLYEKHGFKVTGEEEAKMGDGSEHIEYIMELALSL